MRKMVLVPESMVGEIMTPAINEKKIVSPEEHYYFELEQEIEKLLNSSLDARTKVREYHRLLDKARSMKASIPFQKIDIANLPATSATSVLPPPPAVPISQLQQITPAIPVSASKIPPPIPPRPVYTPSYSPPYILPTKSTVAEVAERRLNQMTNRLQNYIASTQPESQILASLKLPPSKKRKASTPKQNKGNSESISFSDTSQWSDEYAKMLDESLQRDFKNAKGQKDLYEQTTVAAADALLNRKSLRDEDDAVMNFGKPTIPDDALLGAVGGQPPRSAFLQEEIVKSPRKKPEKRYPTRTRKGPKEWRD